MSEIKDAIAADTSGIARSLEERLKFLCKSSDTKATTSWADDVGELSPTTHATPATT